MPSTKEMFFNADGTRVIPSTFKHELVWDIWNDSAPPSWLNLTGTIAYQTVSGGGTGKVRLTTGAVSGNSATAKLAFTLDSTKFAEISIRLDGYRTDQDAVNKASTLLGIFNFSPKAGGAFRHVVDGGANRAWWTWFNDRTAVKDIDTGFAKVRFFGLNYGITDSSIELVIRPKEKKMFFLHGGVVYDEVELNDGGFANVYKDGSLTPSLEFHTREAVAHWCEFSKLTITAVPI